MAEEKTKKIERCKFSHLRFNGDRYCTQAGIADDKIVYINEAQCESCERYKSRYIEFPITVNGIDIKPIDTTSFSAKAGDLVGVRPCGKEYEGKTYLGIFLGDLPIQNTVLFSEETKTLSVNAHTNPAMFVPELKKIIYGCGSWWYKIKSEKDLRSITDEDINEAWYVKMMHQLKDEPKRRGVTLKEGDCFQQAWKGVQFAMWFKVIQIDRPNNSLHVECHSGIGSMHEEIWDDLDTTESAFDLGEYKMINPDANPGDKEEKK